MRRFNLRHGVLLTLGGLAACSADATTAPLTSTTAAVSVPDARARTAVLDGLRALGVDEDVLATTRIDNVQVYGGGAVVSQLSQWIDGVEVFGGGVSVVLDRSQRPLTMTGALVRTLRPTSAFALDARDAVTRAVTKMVGAPLAVSPAEQGGEYTRFDVRVDGALVHSARAKRVWFRGKRLIAAHYVELDIGEAHGSDAALRSFVVSAVDGAILFEHDLVANDTFTYRVWAEGSGTLAPWAGPHGAAITPHPTGTIDSTIVTPLASALVTLQNAPFSKNDPWLAPDAVETIGNNVNAYADLKSPDGFNEGDLRPKTTAARTFDFTYDATKNPNADATNTAATTTQLFYIINWMHDWFYDAGWDEASRNPQQSNLGRGGIANDRIRIEAQDYSGRNNANAATPADGGAPRIQMYLFNGQGKSTLAVTAPASIAGPLAVRAAQFGPSNFDITSQVVLVDDGGGTLTDGCDVPFVNAAAIKGKIVLIDRGNCPFSQKVLNAEAAGAAAVLIANNVDGGAPTLGGAEGTVVKTPTLGTSLGDGNKIKGQLATGVTLQFKRETALDRDGGLDTAIVSHEWAHVLSNRLIGNGNGLINTQGGGMGEGWSDFVSLLTLLRTSDLEKAKADGYSGTYPVGGWVYGVGSGVGSYFGIRRYPYSAKLDKNPLTFKHIQNGVPLPDEIPNSFGDDGTQNAEVHATGEVWSAMLWQCYVQLLRDGGHDYEETTKRMREYLVAGMKATPREPTILEARDALLTAIYAADQADFKLCAKGFAERGAGVGAKGPPRESRTNVGVTESFVTGNDLEVVSLSLAEATSCDGDGTLDNGETGTLTVKLRNIGTDTLSGVSAKLSSKSGKFSFGGDAKLTFGDFKPFESVEATVEVTLNGADAVSTQDIDLAIEAPGLAVPRTISAKLPLVVDFDVKPESATVDTVESGESTWKATGDQKLARKTPWHLVTEGINQYWAIIGNENISDQYLVSPPLVVAADKPLIMSFSHRFTFEYNTSRKQAWDGGVVEISTDDGMTWTDIGESAYNGTLQINESDNPLKGRKAFVNKSAGYPEFQKVTLDLGAAYAGQTVRVRFRLGTDEGTASVGWDVDEMSFDGITNTPFASRVADTTACGAAPTDDAGLTPAAALDATAGGAGCGCSTPTQRSSALTSGALLALAALLLRRRTR